MLPELPFPTLTQFTMGGSSDAEIATPISGPAAPCSKATATPVPDVSAQKILIHKERELPLQEKNHMNSFYKQQVKTRSLLAAISVK